ncbi:uncharacterized protein LOC118434537 [Folsomia candida]|nr:uncharacterized protein LOC118434537 [Folsomia candida]
MSELVASYPNLVTLIIRDSASGLKASGQDLIRWAILNDFGLQLILGQLNKLKHFDVKGNLFFVTDCGITGFSEGEVEVRKLGGGKKVANIPNNDVDTVSPPASDDRTTEKNNDKRISFSSLKSLQYCSLEYVGPKFTSVSLQYGFSGLEELKHLKISGLIQVDSESITKFKDNFLSGKKEKDFCNIEITPLKQ